MKKRLLATMLFCICSSIIAGCGAKEVNVEESNFSTIESTEEELSEISVSSSKEVTTSTETTQIISCTTEFEETTETSINTPQNAKWDDLFWGRATWSSVAEADYYEIEFFGRIYTVTQTWCDLAGSLDYNGSNAFKVRACSANNNNSSWKLSEVLNLTEDVYWDEYPDGAFPHNVNSKTYSQTNTWICEEKSRYYLNQYGIKAAGWLDNGGKRYYMNSDGSMHTGWKYIGGSNYYFDPENGHMLCCISIEIDGTRYNFDNRGHLVKNVWMYEEESGSPYYIDGTGNRVTSQFFTVDGETYYADSYGLVVMDTWMQIDGDYYYFYCDGRLARNTIIDGQYSVDNHGRLVK